MAKRSGSRPLYKFTKIFSRRPVQWMQRLIWHTAAISSYRIRLCMTTPLPHLAYESARYMIQLNKSVFIKKRYIVITGSIKNKLFSLWKVPHSTPRRNSKAGNKKVSWQVNLRVGHSLCIHYRVRRLTWGLDSSGSHRCSVLEVSTLSSVSMTGSERVCAATAQRFCERF
jgi:hypothetical protein